MRRILLMVLCTATVTTAFEAPEWASPASVPEIEPIYALVDSDALNLRDAPSVDGNKIGLLHKGDRVEVLAWAVGFDHWESEYVWAEVRFGDLRGYVAAEEDNYHWGKWGERYLVVEHDFGSYELETEADLDGDGTLERIYVGPGEMYVEEEPYWYETAWFHYLPIILRVEGSFDAEVRLNDFFLGVNTEKIPVEELIARLEELGELGWYYNWSLYGLEAVDFDGDGAVELRLTLDYRSSFPSPLMQPTFTHRRVLGFAWEDDELRCIYGYTEQAFVPEYDDGPTGNWAYVEGWAELTPETLRYRAVMCFPEESVPFANFRTIDVHAWLDELDWVRHPLPPPDYLATGRWFSTDLEARWIPEAGFYALYCPPGNDYARPLGYYCSPVHPLELLYDARWEDTLYVELSEPLTLFCLPESGSAEAGVLEAGTSVMSLSFSTSKGDWYLVYTGGWDVFYEEATPLMGWSRELPLEE